MCNTKLIFIIDDTLGASVPAQPMPAQPMPHGSGPTTTIRLTTDQRFGGLSVGNFREHDDRVLFTGWSTVQLTANELREIADRMDASET